MGFRSVGHSQGATMLILGGILRSRGLLWGSLRCPGHPCGDARQLPKWCPSPPQKISKKGKAELLKTQRKVRIKSEHVNKHTGKRQVSKWSFSQTWKNTRAAQAVKRRFWGGFGDALWGRGFQGGFGDALGELPITFFRLPRFVFSLPLCRKKCLQESPTPPCFVS